MCFDTIPKVYIKKAIHMRDRPDTTARILGSVARTHVDEKDANGNAVEQHHKYLLCKGHRQRSHARGNSKRDKRSTQKWQLNLPLKESWQRQTEMFLSSC